MSKRIMAVEAVAIALAGSILVVSAGQGQETPAAQVQRPSVAPVAPPVPPVTTPGAVTMAPTDASEAIMLMERIQKLIDETQAANADKANLKGTIEVSRKTLDEIHTAAAQVRIMLSDHAH